jgi:hypothetical protein
MGGPPKHKLGIAFAGAVPFEASMPPLSPRPTLTREALRAGLDAHLAGPT